MNKVFKIGSWVLPIVCMTIGLIACSDNSYKGFVMPSDNIPEENIPVMIAVGNPEINDIVSRGSGVIDQTDNDLWRNAYIYIYSFKRDMSTNYSVLSTEDDEMCLIDASTQEHSSKLGKKAKINGNETYISWADGSENVFYHSNNLPYDFFGYYIDDMEIGEQEVIRTGEGVKLKVRIDGRQDLMSARASLTEEQANRKTYTEEERENIKEWYYSTYTAQRNIQPIMIFKHHLSRFIFRIYPARKDANEVIITGIKVKSKRNGLFTVAHSVVGNMGVDFSEEQSYEDLSLLEKDGSPLLTDTYHTDYNGDFSESLYERPYVEIGGSLILPPEETSYDCEVEMKQTIDGTTHTYTSLTKLNNTEGVFKAGMQYTIRLSIYGLQDVDATVVPTPWENGGEVVVDPDKDFGK